MQENNQKKCFNCNYLNLESAVTCVNCGMQIGFNNYPNNSNPSMNNVNEQPANIINNTINKVTDNKKEKNASQMLWVYIGHWLLYGFLAGILERVVIAIVPALVLKFVLSLLIVAGSLYLMATRIFVKNKLYKNQTKKFIKNVKTFYNIWFIIQLVLFYLSNNRVLSYIFEYGISEMIGEAVVISMLLNAVSIILGNIIFPRIIIVPLIRKHSIESSNEEIK